MRNDGTVFMDHEVHSYLQDMGIKNLVANGFGALLIR